MRYTRCPLAIFKKLNVITNNNLSWGIKLKYAWDFFLYIRDLMMKCTYELQMYSNDIL